MLFMQPANAKQSARWFCAQQVTLLLLELSAAAAAAVDGTIISRPESVRAAPPSADDTDTTLISCADNMTESVLRLNENREKDHMRVP